MPLFHRTIITKRKIRNILIALLLCAAGYILLALLPYVGRLYVSAETHDDFSMESFFGSYIIPEQVMLLDDPHDAFFHRVNIISAAEHQIFVASYSISEGASTDIFIGALLAAADRGVKVTLMTNEIIGGMSIEYRRVLAGHENINIYWFNPLELLSPQYINAIFHDKYITVDNRFLILGGRNIGDRFFNPECFDGSVTLDIDVLVYNTDTNFTGTIADVNSYFLSKVNSPRTSLFTRERRSNWDAQKTYYINIYNNYNATLKTEAFDYLSNTITTNQITLLTNNFETAKKESIVAYNLLMIAKNSQSVIAQSPYFSMTRTSIDLFGETIKNIDFTLLTNSLASTPNLPAFSNYYVNRRYILQTTGITIYEYQCTNSSLHGKVYLFDGRLTAIGSFNLNERSMRSDTESTLVIHSEEFWNVTMEVINNFMSMSLRVGTDNRYIPRDGVEEAQVPRGKRTLYIAAGHLLRSFRFMF